MDVIASLRRFPSPLLARLAPAQVDVLMRYLKPGSVRSGVRIVQQGEESSTMFLVLAGHARLERHGIPIGTIGPGDVFGELGLLSNRPRAASVVATSAMDLLQLDKSTWTRLLEDVPQVAAAVLLGVIEDLGGQLMALTDGAVLQFDGTNHPERPHLRVEHVVHDKVQRTERVAKGTRVSALIPHRHEGALVVAALLDNHPVTLSTRLSSDCRLAPMTLATMEGREVLRQCAGLFFLAAAARVAPEQRYRLGAAIGPGCIVHCDAEAALHLSQLQTAMAKLAIERAPFVRELWTTDAARTWLASRGHEDAVAALRSMRSSTVVMAGIDGVFFPALGPVLPNAEDLSSVRLVAHPDGMMLDLSDLLGPFVFGPSRDAALTAETTAPRFGAEMTREHMRWLGSMSVTSAGAFNDQCVSGKVRDVIRVAEGFHEKRLGRIADAIAARSGQVRVICIAGPSSSGKTTFIKRLTVQLKVNGVHPVNIGLDDYYVDRERTPRDQHGDFDFEAVEAIDVPLFKSQLRRILAGELVRTARFDFKTGRHMPEGGHDVKLGATDVLVIEGIHGLNPVLMEDVLASDQVFRVFVHPAATLRFDAAALLAPADVRLLRRIVRDRHARGYNAAETIARWPSVRRGEETHIYTHLQHADVVFDTSLVYEVSVLKVYADRYLLEVAQDHPSFPTAYRLRHLLDRFVTITPDHVPPTSILREFIGGSGFEY